MEPAKSIIAKLGGPAKVAEIADTSYTAPYRWQHSRAKGGCEGAIPQEYHRALLEYAHSNGIDLTAEDFLLPADRAPRPKKPRKARHPERAA